MIKVPLGKGATQTDFPLSPPEFEQPNQFRKQLLENPQNYWQFLKNIMDSGSFIHSGFQIVTTDGAIIAEIIPPNGSTFYFLGANGRNLEGGTVTFSLQTVIEGETFLLDSAITQLIAAAEHKVEFPLQFGSLVGNGTNSFQVFGDGASGNEKGASIWGYFADTPKLSSRIRSS